MSEILNRIKSKHPAAWLVIPTLAKTNAYATTVEPTKIVQGLAVIIPLEFQNQDAANRAIHELTKLEVRLQSQV